MNKPHDLPIPSSLEEGRAGVGGASPSPVSSSPTIIVVYEEHRAEKTDAYTKFTFSPTPIKRIWIGGGLTHRRYAALFDSHAVYVRVVRRSNRGNLHIIDLNITRDSYINYLGEVSEVPPEFESIIRLLRTESEKLSLLEEDGGLPQLDDVIVEEILDRIYKAAPIDFEYYPCMYTIVTAWLRLIDIINTEEEEIVNELKSFGFTPLSASEIAEFESCLNQDALYFKLPRRENDPYTLLEVIITPEKTELYAFRIFRIVRWEEH